MNELPRSLKWIFALSMLLTLAGCSDSDSSEANAIPRYHLTMDEYLLEELYSRPLSDDERLPATLTVHTAGMEDEPVEVRFRGSLSLREAKKGFSIRFEESEPRLAWNGYQLAVRSSWRDPTFMRESISMWLHNQLDTLAPRTKHFLLFMNDSFEGLYQQVERIDESFLEARGLNPDGTLVRDEARHNQGEVCVNSWTSFSFNFSTLDRETSLSCISSVFRSRNADWNELLDLLLWAEEVLNLSRDEFRQEFGNFFDVEYIVRYMAARLLVAEEDDLYQTDYWLYKSPSPESKWKLIAWDRNSSFGGIRGRNTWYNHSYMTGIGSNRLMRRFMSQDGFLDEVVEYTLSLLDSDTYGEQLDTVIDQFEERVSGYAGRTDIFSKEFSFNEANHASMLGEHYEHVQSLRDFRDLRRNFLRMHLYGLVNELTENNAGSSSVVITEEDIERGVLWFVDSDGMSLASLELFSGLNVGDVVEVAVVPGGTTNPISKDWRLSSSTAFRGQLNLFYRNEPQENWYTGAEAGGGPNSWNGRWVQKGDLGRQRDIAVVGIGSSVSVGESAVLPFSNKISFSISVERSADFYLSTEYRSN